MNVTPAGRTGAAEPDVDLDALRRGDNAAWDAFFVRFDPLIESVTCWSKWRFRPHEREELVQDIRAELARSIPTFRGDASLPYFIKRICVNRCIDRIRRQVREREVMCSIHYEGRDGSAREVTAEADAGYNPVARILAHESALAVRRLLGEVSETCGEAIRMFYIDQMPYREIGEKLGISVNTVGSRLSKCLDKLRQLARREPLLGEDGE